MARDKHLEKDEELRLGRLVQNMLQAQERLKSGSNITDESPRRAGARRCGRGP